MPSRLSQTKNSQCLQVFAGLSFGDPLAKLFIHFPERQSSTGFAQTQQHPLLPLRHILRDPPRRHITCGAEPHRHAAACLQNLRAGQTGAHRQFPHPDRPPAPRLDDPAPVKHPRDERIPRQRFMRQIECLRCQAKMQRAQDSISATVIMSRPPVWIRAPPRSTPRSAASAFPRMRDCSARRGCGRKWRDPAAG